jgi:hypothetical protein
MTDYETTRDRSSRNVLATLIVIALLVFAVILVLSFRDRTGNTGATLDPNEQTTGIPERITALHQFANGTHIVAGEIPMESFCDLLSTSVTINDTVTPQEATIFFTTRRAEDCPIDEGEGVTSARFREDIIAPEDTVITAQFNNQEAILNLIEAGPDDNLDDFDVFVKG